MSFKRLFCLVFTVLICFCLSVKAENFGGDINVFYTEINSGEYLDIPLKISDCKGIISLIAEIDYDSDSMELESVKNGDFFESAPMKSQYITDIPYKIYWEDTVLGDRTGDGTLCTLRFKVTSGKNTKITVTVSDCFNSKFEDVELKVYSVSSTKNASSSINSNSSAVSSDSLAPQSSQAKSTSSNSASTVAQKNNISYIDNTVTVKTEENITPEKYEVFVVTENGETKKADFHKTENDNEIKFFYDEPEQIQQVQIKPKEQKAFNYWLWLIPFFLLIIGSTVIVLLIKKSKSRV